MVSKFLWKKIQTQNVNKIQEEQNQDFGPEILRVLTVKFDLNKYSNVYPFKSNTALASLNFDLFPVEFFAVEPGDFAVYRFCNRFARQFHQRIKKT